MDNERWPQPLRAQSDLGSGSGEQNDEKAISYSAARDISGGVAILRKIDNPNLFRRTVNEELSNVPTEIRENLFTAYLPGRMRPHLFRLLGREGPEYDFAVAFMKYAPPLLRGDEGFKEAVDAVISSEYSDTMMWWTFVPYLYAAMVNKGVAEQDAIQKVLAWAKTAPPYQDYQSMGIYHLAGLEIFNTEKINRYALSNKLGDISHRFTQQEAERIIKDVFGIEEKKK